MVLLGAIVAALLWANSPWSDSYESLWTTKLAITVGDGSGISTDLRHWVNEGLMTFFFLVIGLEAKREIDLGKLRERRRLAIPAFAAIGGMVVPVAIYLAFNAGGSGAHGWGAAMSTEATELSRSFREQPTPELARSARQGVLSVISPNERLQHGLHPWTSYVIVPLFALANAGVHVTGRCCETPPARRSRSASSWATSSASRWASRARRGWRRDRGWAGRDRR